MRSCGRSTLPAGKVRLFGAVLVWGVGGRREKGGGVAGLIRAGGWCWGGEVFLNRRRRLPLGLLSWSASSSLSSSYDTPCHLSLRVLFLALPGLFLLSLSLVLAQFQFFGRFFLSLSPCPCRRAAGLRWHGCQYGLEQ